ncbi:hypothetical protein HDU97_006978 [Phlyctochytrium planicorne]|nr:hypothetical protein HDU97_006978 [Phlyctochytrium planicorne]
MLRRLANSGCHALKANTYRRLSPTVGPLNLSTLPLNQMQPLARNMTTTSIPESKLLMDLQQQFLSSTAASTPLIQAEDPLITAFVNNIMKHGKKTKAQRIVKDALQHLQAQKPDQDPRAVLGEAMEKVQPLIKVVGTKRGSKSVQVPKPLNEKQRRRIAILWIIQEASKRHKRNSMGQRVGMELIAVLEGDSATLTKKSQMHKAALQNRSNIVLMDRKELSKTMKLVSEVKTKRMIVDAFQLLTDKRL